MVWLKVLSHVFLSTFNVIPRPYLVLIMYAVFSLSFCLQLCLFVCLFSRKIIEAKPAAQLILLCC